VRVEAKPIVYWIFKLVKNLQLHYAEVSLINLCNGIEELKNFKVLSRAQYLELINCHLK